MAVIKRNLYWILLYCVLYLLLYASSLPAAVLPAERGAGMYPSQGYLFAQEVYPRTHTSDAAAIPGDEPPAQNPWHKPHENVAGRLHCP